MYLPAEGNVVLDSGCIDVLYARYVFYFEPPSLSFPFFLLRSVVDVFFFSFGNVGASIAEIVSAFPTCGGL